MDSKGGEEMLQTPEDGMGWEREQEMSVHGGLFLPFIEAAGTNTNPITTVVTAGNTLVWARPPTAITGAKRITDMALLNWERQ